MKVSTDAKKITELLERGVENIYPTREFLEKELKSGRQLTLYTGYDPTATTLHIGHGITLMKLRQFQDLGHKVTMLIGDFTGMIGDPTDKTAVRHQLNHEQVITNCRNYRKQASAILDFNGKNPVEIKYNYEWYEKMKLIYFIDLTSKFTVQRMLERDMFQERIKSEKPVYLHEFLYPVMQAYDSVFMNVDGEVGGNDQTFNMLAGRNLMAELKKLERYKHLRDKFVLTMKLLSDTTGKKMGKSEGNMVALSDTPEDMFGKVMSWSDEMIKGGFELCTGLEVPSEKVIKSEPMKYKKLLAYEIVKTFLGDREAKQAQEYFVSTFSKKEIPDGMPEVKPSVYDVTTALVEGKICKSKSEARQNIDQGGVKINDAKVGAKGYGTAVKKGDVIQKGSRFFVRVK